MAQHGHDRNEQRTLWAAVLTGGFMFVEIAGGIIAGSLALIADSAHMFTDAVALGFAWFAFRLAHRPADARRTFGFDRFQILVAFANGISLLFVIGWIVYEAVLRFTQPVDVLGGTMLLTAGAGLAVNIIAFVALHGADRENLNVRGALLHVTGDLLGSLAALTAAIVIIETGWTPIDPLLSLLIALILIRSAWRLIRQSGHILLEGTPTSIDIADIKHDLEAHVTGVCGVHHIHAWSLTQERPLITLHAKIEKDGDLERVVADIKARLNKRFGVSHATVEIELTK